MRAPFPARDAWRLDQRAPRPKRPSVPLIHVENRLGIEVRILSRAMVGTWTHNIDGRTKPCTGEQGACWIDHKQTSAEWHGWLIVSRPRVQEQRLLALTLLAVDSAPDLQDPAQDLRGLLLRVWRLGNARRCKMNARLYTADRDLVDLPEAVDVIPQLERMWAAPNRDRRTASDVWSAWRKGGGR